MKNKSAILPSTVTVLDKNAFEGSDYTVALYTSNKEQLSDHDKFVAAGVKHKTVYSNLIGTGWSYDDFTFDGATVTGWSDQGNKTRLKVKDLIIPEINAGTNNDHVVILYTSNPEHLKFEESDVQKIVFRAEWGADCFTFDENGVLTGLSEKGKALVKQNTDVVIPDETANGKAITEIAADAFSGYGITSVKLPKGLKCIGEKAFAGNEKVVKLKVPDKEVYDKLKDTEYDNAELDWKAEEPDPTPDPGTKDDPSNGNNGNAGNTGNVRRGSSRSERAVHRFFLCHTICSRCWISVRRQSGWNTEKYVCRENAGKW